MSDENTPPETPSGETPDAAPEATPEPTPEQTATREAVIDVLKRIYDPEIPVNIYDLGLIYTVDVDEAGNVAISMTLTSPACPVAESLPPEVQDKVSEVESVASAKVDLTWEPPWGPDKMTEAAKLTLNF